MKETVRVGIVGSRSITDEEYVFYVLNFYLRRLLAEKEVIIVSGGAVGTDKIAEKFAEQKGIEAEIYEPEYDKFPTKVAPIKRNQTIVDNSDYLIAIFDGSSKGTASTIRMAEKRNIPIKIVKI